MKRILFIAAILLIAYSALGQNTIMHQGKIGMQYTVSGTQKNLLMDFTADSTRFVIGNTWYTFDKSIVLRPNKIIKTGTDTLSTKAYVRSKMGSGSQSTSLAKFYADASTSGTGITDLYSYTIPANTLSANGDVIYAFYAVNGVVSTDPATITIAFGSSTQALTVTSSDWGPGLFEITVRIIRTSSSAARAFISINSPEEGKFNSFYCSWTSLDFTSTINLKLRGTSPTGTMTARFGYINKL